MCDTPIFIMFSSLVQLFLLALVSIVTADESLLTINGNDAQPGQFPFMASIRVKGKHLCGGAIIHSKFILTAGHCVKAAGRVQLRDVTVLTGTIYLNDWMGTISSVQNMYAADGDGEIPSTDVGLIRLNRQLVWNSKTKSILTTYDPPPVNDYATVVGWGSKDSKVTTPTNRLQYQQAFITQSCSPFNTGKTICTNDGPNNGVCYGDSGSPLIYRNQVVGVVSRAVLCGKGLPDVYSSVPENMDYIQSIIMSS